MDIKLGLTDSNKERKSVDARLGLAVTKTVDLWM